MVAMGGMKKPGSLRISGSDLAFEIINTVLLLFAFILVAYPLLYVLSSSFSSVEATRTGRVRLVPIQPSLEAYRVLFQYKKVWIGYGNSAFYAIFGTLINVTLTILAGYPLSRRDFKARHVYMGLFVFTMLFSGGLIPNYLLVRNLGMLNTRWAMLLPTGMAVWNVIITRTFFQSTIPTELLEAARMDGCTDIRFLFQVVIPLSGAIIAVNSLFYAVFHWNAFFHAFIYLSNERLLPLQVFLRDILILNTIDSEVMDTKEFAEREGLRDLLQYALIVVASVPVLAIYPFVQKHFVKGVMIGSLKG